MKQQLHIDNWVRKDHYFFFRQFEEPFFGITANVDCTAAYNNAKHKKCSFFLYYLHKSLVAANKIEPFRYRIAGDDVFVYDQVNASPTINRKDGTFGFSYMDYHEEFDAFNREATSEIGRVQSSTGLVPAVSGENVIHYSSIPWISFTAISHARAFSFKDSCPKISFGKVTGKKKKLKMPVSIHVHHALMDGYSVAQYIELFQELLNKE
jgi:chloramphenicol O-acetyltransferase type A